MLHCLKRGVLALAALCTVIAPAAVAQPRIALVIGNADYQAGGLPRLNNAVNDAKLIDATLSKLGFQVMLRTNASEDEMEKAIRDFGAALKAAGPTAVGLYYFSGHGVQSDGINYMVPVDAEVQTVEDVESEAPRMGLVLRQMDLAANATNFVILDACRNNNLPSQSRSAERGLVAVSNQAGGSVLIAYATRPGAVAADGDKNNSPYTEVLARLIASEGVPAELLFKRVSDQVRAATRNRQQPWTENGLSGADFCFVACGSNAASSAPAPRSLPDPAMSPHGVATGPVFPFPPTAQERARLNQRSGPVTYSEDVAPALIQFCISCHYTGNSTSLVAFSGWNNVWGQSPLFTKVLTPGTASYRSHRMDELGMSDNLRNRIINWVKSNTPKDRGEADSLPSAMPILPR